MVYVYDYLLSTKIMNSVRRRRVKCDGNWVHLNGSPVGFQVGEKVGSRWYLSLAFLSGWRGESEVR